MFLPSRRVSDGLQPVLEVGQGLGVGAEATAAAAIPRVLRLRRCLDGSGDDSAKREYDRP